MVKKIIVGSLFGNFITVVCVIFLSFLDYQIVMGGERLNFMMAVDGLVAVLFGAYLTGYYVKAESLYEVFQAALAFSIIASAISIIYTLYGLMSSTPVGWTSLVRGDFYFWILRGFVLNIMSSIIAVSLGSVSKIGIER